MNGINLHFVNITLQSTLFFSNFNDLTSKKKGEGGGGEHYALRNSHTMLIIILYPVLIKHYTVEPRYFEVPREMEKQFEIAGFRNNRGSVKFITTNHFLIKYSTV